MIYELLNSTTTIAILIILVSVFIIRIRSKNVGNVNVPGPRAFPFFGTMWIFHFGVYDLSDVHKFYEELYRKYGPVVKEEAFGNVPIYNLFEKNDIEKILKAPSKYPVRPPVEPLVYYRGSRPDRYSSAGLVNEQGEKWYSLRSSLTPDLMSPKTINNFKDEAYSLAEEWCNIIKLKKDSNNFIENIEASIVTLCIETTCALVLGRRLGFMEPDKISEKLLKLNEALEKHFIGIRDIQFSLPLWKYFETKPYKTLIECENLIYETVLEFVENYAESDYENSVYSSIIHAKIDEKEKTAAIIDFIAAGIHTLKNSLIFLLYSVAKNPETQDRIIEDLNYAKACMIESFRLLPTATPLARITEQNFELSGHLIKSGSVILCHNSIACKNAENFQLPNEFKPERWLNNADLKSNSSFLITPFGCGKRICPGKRFIELVLPIFLQTTARNFTLKTEQNLELKFEFLMAPKGPVSMYFTERN